MVVNTWYQGFIKSLTQISGIGLTMYVLSVAVRREISLHKCDVLIVIEK